MTRVERQRTPMSRGRTWLALGMLLMLPQVHAESLPRAAHHAALQLTSIRELLDTHADRSEVLLRGAVTYNGRELMVQDQTGAVSVAPSSPVSLALGDQVEVRGALHNRNGTPTVEDASVHNLWEGSTPLPLAITPDEAAEGGYNGMLVATEGKLVRAGDMPTGGLRLTLASGDQMFSCLLEQGSAGVLLSLTPGETLRCTGVLSVNRTDRAFESGTFLVSLRSPQDLHLLSPAPWWTPRHTLWCLPGLLPLALLGYLLHVRSMRARMSLIVEERSRIAREIHDTLAQGFSGIALQLQAIDRSMGQRSSVTEDHLAMALQMVRRSRAEAHRSIATLRTLHSNSRLDVICDKLLRQLTGPAGLALRVQEKGTAYPLHDELCSHIVRICQEAVANTVEHARATRITATIQYSPGSVAVLIEDDGCGFDPATANSVEHGHFGIAGMRERAAQLRGTLHIDSGRGGTSLCLQVPTGRARSRAGILQWSARLLQRRPQQPAQQQVQQRGMHA